MQVTVVIPAHNRRLELERAVESVRAGRVQPSELIVVDDGSTDGTAEWLEAQTDIRALVHPRNRGVAAARNSGINAAESAWIALLDSDDWWLPDHLERLAQHAADNPACRIVQTRERWFRGGKRVNPRVHHVPPTGDIFEPSLSLCLVSSSAVLFERSLFDEVGGYDARMPACEDYDLWLRMALRASVDLVDVETIEKEGGRDDQLSRRFWGMDRFRVYSMAKLLASGRLTEAQASATRAVCLKKLEVLAGGAGKRGRDADVAAYGRWADAVRGHPDVELSWADPSSDPILTALLGDERDKRHYSG